MKFKLPVLKTKQQTLPDAEAAAAASFLDLTAPNAMKFWPDHFLCGNTYRAVWAITSYLYTTEEQALLADLSAMSGITLHIRHSALSPIAEDQIIQNAQRKNANGLFSKDVKTSAGAVDDAKDLANLLRKKRKDKEPLIDVSVFVEIKADTLELLLSREQEVQQLLSAAKIEVDRLLLTQKEGFLSVLPGGAAMRSGKLSRVMPASSAANLFPFSYAGKLDPHGFRIGKDRHGGDIIVDLSAREADKTNSHCCILGNSGEGKSYLVKLLLQCVAESGLRIIIIDPDGEYRDLVLALGGSYIDCTGQYIINPLEVRSNTLAEEKEEEDPATQAGNVARHIAYLRDFFAAYKAFPAVQLDALEVLLAQLYKSFDITDERLGATDPAQIIYPTMKDLYELIDAKHGSLSATSTQLGQDKLFTEELLRELKLGIHSICVGADSLYFSGQTNIPSGRIVAFCYKELLDTNENLLNANLFNSLSYMHHHMMTGGNTVGIIDELHLFLRYSVAINYIRADIKRGRKKESFLILATQNIEDLLLPGIRELTKPIFTIPTHSFLFYPGYVNKEEYLDMCNVTEEEFALIAHPARGSCLYRCGAERYHLQVEAPPHKQLLIGSSGGR